MNLYEKYLNHQEEEVWAELNSINDISKIVDLSDIDMILNECMNRILKNIQYLKKILPQIKIDLPADNEKEKVKNLEKRIQSFGHIPLVFSYFLSKIGFVTFCNDDRLSEDDPFYVESINGILEMLEDGSWEENMLENEEEGLPYYIEFSPDYLHKANISGGLPYGIELTHNLQIDSRVLNTEYGEMKFIDYLNQVFLKGGFMRNNNKIQYHGILRL
jgi:hypothetical protein